MFVGYIRKQKNRNKAKSIQIKRRSENKIVDLCTPPPFKPGLHANSQHKQHADFVAGLWNRGIIPITYSHIL